MTIAQGNQPTSPRPLRLWPGVVVLVVQWLGFVLGFVFPPQAMMYGMLGGVLAGLVIAVWWLFFSRAPWSERVSAIVLIAFAVIVTKRLVHPSIENAGMGMMLYFLAIPVMSLALVAWAAASRGLAAGPRRASMAAAILLGCGVFMLLRSGGMSGDGLFDLHWRWTPTPEDRLLAQADGPEAASAPAAVATAMPEAPVPEPPSPASAPTGSKFPAKPALAQTGHESKAPAAAPVAAAPIAEWPGFRGPDRDSVVHARIETDWSKSPPVELWRRKVGPGWSSFAVQGGLLYTQEQRGEDEVVSCYKATTGEPVWRHTDAARFWESNAGPGPRATPTLGNGRVYTLGATGVLNALDAKSGAVVWSRNAVTDTGAKIPAWGIAGSPLLVDDLLVVAASGRLAGYDAATGTPRWFTKTRGGGYSSPQLTTIGGIAQVLLMSGGGLTSVAPADGTLLWEHGWEGAAILQSARTSDGDVLITTADMSGGVGTRRIAVAYGPGGWKTEERWTSRSLKPYFSDFVIHQGHALGFDGSILACIDLADGARKWKGGRYGHGQLLLLPEQDLLLVLSEDGELALVKATADQFTEVARFPAIEGKTWNHPVLVGDLLFVRNGEEMAAFRLARAGD